MFKKISLIFLTKSKEQFYSKKVWSLEIKKKVLAAVE